MTAGIIPVTWGFSMKMAFSGMQAVLRDLRKLGEKWSHLLKLRIYLEKLLPEGVSCCVVEIPDDKKGSYIVATVSEEVNKTEILRKMLKELPIIALPRQFIVIKELPMMSTGKIDFRSVTRLVQEILSTSNPDQ